MDVKYFLNLRTKFIQNFYEMAAVPFRETIRKIEAEEAPYKPEYYDDDELAFLEEWQDADTGLNILGEVCISMLSESLKLYFNTWEAELHIKWESGERDRYFTKGFVQGYKRCFGELLQIRWDDYPVNFGILEQITLARNDAQHPKHISRLNAQHSMDSRAKFPSPLFVSDSERALVSINNPLAQWFAPSIDVSSAALMAAIAEVELIASYLESHLIAKRDGG